MTCIYHYNDNSNNTTPLTPTTANIVDNINVSEQDIPCGVIKHKPLPSVVTDFIAESMCGILETHQPPKYISWNLVPLPELVFFVERVTSRAKVDVYTALVALILVSRLKKRLPRNAHGEYGTCHKIFLSAILVASKEFMTRQSLQKKEELYPTPVTCLSPSSSSPISSPSDEYASLSTTPLSTSSSSSSLSSSDDAPQRHQLRCRQSIINQKLAEISGIYTLEEVNQMEKSFIKLLGHHNTWVTDNDVRNFLEKNRYALGICEKSIDRR